MRVPTDRIDHRDHRDHRDHPSSLPACPRAASPLDAGERALSHRPRLAGLRLGWRRLATLLLWAGIATGARAPTAAAQESRPDSTSASAERGGGSGAAANDEIAASDSPRASLAAFLHLTSGARYDSAAAYLSLSAERAGEGAALSRQLRAVLDRHVRLDLDRIAGTTTGDTTDGLAAGVD